MFSLKQKVQCLVSYVLTASFTCLDLSKLLLKSVAAFNKGQCVLQLTQGVEISREMVCFHFGAKGLERCLTKLCG